MTPYSFNEKDTQWYKTTRWAFRISDKKIDMKKKKRI